MKKLLVLGAFIFAGQANAQETPLQDVAVSAVDSVEQEVETLESVLADLENGKISPEKVNAILMAVERMKNNNVSDEYLIEFVKTLSAEKIVKNYTKLKLFISVLMLAAGAGVAYKMYSIYRENKGLKDYLQELNDLASVCAGQQVWVKEGLDAKEGDAVANGVHIFGMTANWSNNNQITPVAQPRTISEVMPK